MAIQTSCPSCEAAYTLADTQRGKKVRCRKCSETFVVGGDKDKAAPVASSVKGRTGLRKDGLQDAPRPAGRSTPPPKTKPAPRRDRDRDDDDFDDDRSDDRPNIKRKRGSSTPMILMIVGGIVLVLLLCGGGGVFAIYWWVSSTVTNGVDNLQQQMANGNPNDPFPQPGDPNNPFGNVPFPDLSQPKDVGEALDWVKNGATADKQKKGAEWLANAAVDNGRQKEVAAALETLAANPKTKDAALSALAAWAGPEDAPTLLREVDAKFDIAGGAAADALVRLQYAPAAPVFAKRLSDFFHHGTAARLLANLGAPLAEKEVLKYLNSSNNEARSEAAALLRTFGTKPDAIFDQTVVDLKSPDANVAKSACDYLAKQPVNEARRAEVSKALEEPLGDPVNGETRKSAATALRTWGTKDNVPALIAEMDNKNDPFHGSQQACMDALARLKDPRGAEAVAAHLPDFGFGRPAVVSALREMGPVAEKAVAAFANSPDQGVRNDVERLLKGYGSNANVKLDAAVSDLDSTDANQRKSALEFLARQAPDDAHQKAVARAVDKLLDDNDPFGNVRKAAAKAEMVWGDKESVPALLTAMQKDNSDIAVECMEALGRIKDERAVVPLILQTAKGKPHIGEAQKALVNMGPVVETALDNGLTDPASSAADKLAACQLLAAEIGTKASIPALTVAAADPDPKVKVAAAAALKRVKMRNP